MHFDHQLFLSYARKDNVPKVPGGEGWVTAFARELRLRHQRYSGRDLKIFFDTQAIEIGRDWKRELGAGLRFPPFPRFPLAELCRDPELPLGVGRVPPAGTLRGPWR
jgi:hypothetical protein